MKSSQIQTLLQTRDLIWPKITSKTNIYETCIFFRLELSEHSAHRETTSLQLNNPNPAKPEPKGVRRDSVIRQVRLD